MKKIHYVSKVHDPRPLEGWRAYVARAVEMWVGPGQRHLARGFERALPKSASGHGGVARPSCVHRWRGGPAMTIICGECGTLWDKGAKDPSDDGMTPVYLKRSLLIRD